MTYLPIGGSHTVEKPWLLVDLQQRRHIEQVSIAAHGDVSPALTDLVVAVGDAFDNTTNPKFQLSSFQSCTSQSSTFGLGKISVQKCMV